jgi:Txe/YoeB family toxin of Txe-Axe toxin-antitoxin module
MMISKDEKVMKAMRWFTERERQYQIIKEYRNAQVRNWKKEEGRMEKGTGPIITRTRNTCYKLDIGLKMNGDEMTITNGESEVKAKTAIGIGHFLTQKLVRAKKFEKLIQQEVHRASYTTLKNNETSNAILTDIYTRRSDAFHRFVVVGRADCLPTPANLQRWFNDRGNENCTRCRKERKQTLAYILNECNLVTKRHNRLTEGVRRALIKFIGKDMRSEIRENQRAGQDGLSERLSALRPDMMLERKDYKPRRREERGRKEGEEQKIIKILEFSRPYGCISHNRDTLEMIYEKKNAKYEELARTLSAQRHEKVRVTVVIVSSMGAIYGPSMKDLQKVLRSNNKSMKKFAKQMSERVILGLLKIGRNYAKRIEQENRDEANKLIAEEEARIEEARIELERERNMKNSESRAQNEREQDFMNEMKADGDIEEFEDEEEEESRHERQVRRREREAETEAEAEIEIEIVRTTARTGTTARDEDKPKEDTETETGRESRTPGDITDDEDGGRDFE